MILAAAVRRMPLPGVAQSAGQRGRRRFPANSPSASPAAAPPAPPPACCSPLKAGLTDVVGHSDIRRVRSVQGSLCPFEAHEVSFYVRDSLCHDHEWYRGML